MMDVMQMAAAVGLTSLHNEISGTEGPFSGDGHRVARIWLRNGYGVSAREIGPDAWELLVIREIRDGGEHWGDETPWMADYSTPVTPPQGEWDTTPVLSVESVEGVESVLCVLSTLPQNDPLDLRRRWAT
jgi:hypothetical protein